MPTSSIQVLSLNILGSHSQPPHEWESRRSQLAAMWQRLSPDIVGIQEGRAHQVSDLKTLLPAYDYVGLSRFHPIDEGEEQCGIWMRRERFTVLESGHFWLSETPDVPASRSWESAFPRMVTWAKLQERASGARLAVFNTHFDHISEEARRQSAILLRARWQEMARAEPEFAVVVMGDFNSRAPLTDSFPGDETYQILTSAREEEPQFAGLRDTFLLSPQRGELRGTFHEFSGKARERIDWILCNQVPNLESADVLDHQPKSTEISDHFGVQATFLLIAN